tara:strand:+ start:2061 stop:2303 length:243 start_codon:yes stop_codon:yes gene_type:complete
MIQSYPFIDVTGALFIGSTVLALVDHFLWFYHFAYNYYDYEGNFLSNPYEYSGITIHVEEMLTRRKNVYETDLDPCLTSI